MTSRSRDRRGTLVVVLLCVLLSGLVLLAGAGQVEAASFSVTRAKLPEDTRPAQPVAYARVAVVRVLVYYIGMLNNDPAPIPVLSPCAADGSSTWSHTATACPACTRRRTWASTA